MGLGRRVRGTGRTPGDRGVPETKKKGEVTIGQGQLWASGQDH